MNCVIVSLGSNSSDRLIQIEVAISHLKSLFENVSVSTIYESEALNGTDFPYLNAVAIFQTQYTIEHVNVLLKEWEKQSGRTFESKLKGSIPIDLDIVVWNGNIVRQSDFSYPFFMRGYNELIALGAISVE